MDDEKRRGKRMKEIVGGSIYFGFFLTIGAYYIGLRVKERLNLGIFNPLLIAILLVMGVLVEIGRAHV